MRYSYHAVTKKKCCWQGNIANLPPYFGHLLPGIFQGGEAKYTTEIWLKPVGTHQRRSAMPLSSNRRESRWTVHSHVRAFLREPWFWKSTCVENLHLPLDVLRLINGFRFNVWIQHSAKPPRQYILEWRSPELCLRLYVVIKCTNKNNKQ